jgi:GcrA cell cycle regulator
MSWTDERVETLKKMWGEGQSASQIAKELGGVTRNAVIGKVHRLGLSNRAGTGATKADAKPKVAKAEPKPKAAPKVEAAPKPTAPVTDVVPTGMPPRSAARLFLRANLCHPSPLQMKSAQRRWRKLAKLRRSQRRSA